MPTFSYTSRYYGADIKLLERPDGQIIAYVARRFVPSPDRFELLQEHEVQLRDRPDTVAYLYLGDAEQFWRICDANAVLHPAELTAEPGRRLRITLPEGIPGAPDA